MKINEVIEKAKEKVKITKEEKDLTQKIINEVIEKLNKTKNELKIDAKIELHGSFAHDTWLSEDKDIDIFIFRRADKFKAIEEGLKIAKKTFPNHIERYAEHPFITVNYKGFNFDIVPAVLIKEGEKIQTAVDRTRLHTHYLSKVLNEELKNEIRIFKKFIKALDIYGAEIKVGGFSGYLCEILIVYYKNFLNLIKEAIKWKPYKTIIGGEWNLNPAPLVVIDPVDKRRNVAAALNKLDIFKYGCMLFLRNPSLKFFEKRKFSANLNLAKKVFEERGSEVLIIEYEHPKVPPDVFWGEAERAKKSLISFLNECGFEIVDSLNYSDEKTKSAILLEIKNFNLSNKKILIGPPLDKLNNFKKFLDKHNSDIIFISNGRVYSYVNRKIRNVNDAVDAWIKFYSLPKDLIKPLRKNKKYSIDKVKDKELIKKIFDLAMKNLWWLRNDLIKKYEIE